MIEDTNLLVVPVEEALKFLITIDAVPVFAASVVLCHVIPPSGFSIVHVAGGNVGFSKPSVTGIVTFPVTKNAFLIVSFDGDSSPVPDEETG